MSILWCLTIPSEGATHQFRPSGCNLQHGPARPLVQVRGPFLFAAAGKLSGESRTIAFFPSCASNLLLKTMEAHNVRHDNVFSSQAIFNKKTMISFTSM
eukprot:scaffold336417_cov20-Prasinocladus_malaysianus.AAC.2